MNNDDKARKAIAKALVHIEANFMTKPKVDDLKSILEEALAPKQQFYSNQPVLVSVDGEEWFPRHFSHISTADRFFCFNDGRSSRVVPAITTSWKYCKPDPDAKSLMNWIDHDGGECPVDSETQVYVIYNNVVNYGHGSGGEARHRTWKDVVKYAVIPLPKY